jgi:hypothetical protein
MKKLLGLVTILSLFSISAFAGNFAGCMKIQTKVERVCKKKGDTHPRCSKLKSRLARRCSSQEDQERLSNIKGQQAGLNSANSGTKCKKLHTRTVRACDRKEKGKRCKKRKKKLLTNCQITL